jgi:acetylornithine deacetylase/succinyl-diaminopimelate desuccinylase-like protein
MSLRDQVQAQLPGVLADLKELVAIESVSADSARTTEVECSAEHIVQLLTDLKCPHVSIIRAKDGAPAVIGRFPAPEGKPTVCLYAHHDVQPEGDPATWHTPPFVATELEGRLYGRGATDDKGGFAVHLAALRAFDGKPPVGVTVFVEGEEEVSSPSLVQVLEEHHAELAADVFVIADSDNWAVGQPAFTTSLRGLAACTVEVRTLDHALHSGVYGGVVPMPSRRFAVFWRPCTMIKATLRCPGLRQLDRQPWCIPRSGYGLSQGSWMALTGSAADLSWSGCGPSRHYR